MTCQGSCCKNQEQKNEARLYQVFNQNSPEAWGLFIYCPKALNLMQLAGYTLIDVNDRECCWESFNQTLRQCPTCLKSA